MNRLATAVFLAAATSVIALVACADSNDEASTEEPGVDASTVVPVADAAGDTDASDAADASVDVEAGARICSDDGFCHSVVPAGQNLRGVWGDGQGVVWAISIEGALLRWDGTTWKLYKQLTPEGGLLAIWGSGPTDLWIAADGGILHGTGATSAALVFAPVTLPGDPTYVIKSIWGTGPNDIWAVGGYENFDGLPITKGRALHYAGPGADGGGAWTLDADLSSRDVSLRGVWGSAGSGVWVQGATATADGFQSYSTVLRRPNGASTWTAESLAPDPSVGYHPQPQDFNAFTMSSDTSVWLAGFNGAFIPAYFHGSKAGGGDAGFTWTTTKGTYFDRPIIAMWGTAPNDTWAAGQDGIVTHWNGTKWESAAIRVTSLPVAKSFWAIWGTASDDFWIVGDEIAIHKTKVGKP